MEEQKKKLGIIFSLPVIGVLLLTKLYIIGIILLIIRFIKIKGMPQKRNLTVTFLLIFIMAFFMFGFPIIGGNETNDIETGEVTEIAKESEIKEEIDDINKSENIIDMVEVEDVIEVEDNTESSTISDNGLIFIFKEESKVNEFLSENKFEPVTLKEEVEIIKDDYYTETYNLTGIQYIGQMKDKRPHGIGELYINNSKVYRGEFKNGSIEGYGEKYENDILIYQGNFKNGKYNGKGNEFIYWDNILIDHDSELGLQYESPSVKDYMENSSMIYAGEFVDDYRDGNFKTSANNMVIYEGEIEGYNYNGNGIEYHYKSEQPKYKGEFKDGIYHGKGTLYDESGNILYKGNWKNGDYAD